MIYDLTVPHFIKALRNLSAILDKGADYATQKKFDVEVLLNSRLAPDQFPLLKQVQIACDTAKLGAARLSGKDAPVHNDQEKTLAEIKQRIQETIAFLNQLNASDFAGSETKKITTPRWEGKYMTGAEFVSHHALPNLYFHIATAYSILRHNGVDVGKKDFLGELPFKNP